MTRTTDQRNEHPRPGRRADLIAIGVLLALCAALWLPRLRGPIDLRYDAGVYYVLGTSLAEGKGYRLANEPGEIRGVQYPPGLPALVALEAKLAGTTDPAVVGRWLRATFAGLFAAYVLSAYLLARQFLGAGGSLLAAAVCCLGLSGVMLSDLLFTEVPFALVTVLFAVLHVRAERAEDAADGRRATLLRAGQCVLAIAAYLVRSAGVALLAAWVAEAVVRRRWRQVALRAAVAVVPVLAWTGYTRHVARGPEYAAPAYAYQRAPYQFYNVTYAENVALIDPFAPERGRVTPAVVAGRVWANLKVMPRSVGESVTAHADMWRWMLDAVGRRAPVPAWASRAVVVPVVGFGLLTLAGAGVLLARRQWFVALYVAASVGVICLTPWPGQFTRYLAPTAPFLALCLVLALAAARRGARAAWPGGARPIAVFVAGVAVVGVGMQAFALGATYFRRFDPVVPIRPAGDATAAAGQRMFYYDPAWADFDRAVAWLDANAAPTDVIATASPHWVYLKTGRKAVMPPMEADTARFQALIDTVPAAYVVVDAMGFLDVARRYAGPAVAADPAQWELAHTSADGATRVYRRVGLPVSTSASPTPSTGVTPPH